MENFNTKEQLEKELKILNTELNQLIILCASLQSKYEKSSNQQTKKQLQASLDTIIPRLINLNSEIHNIKMSAVTEIIDNEEAENIRKNFDGTTTYEEDFPKRM